MNHCLRHSVNHLLQDHLRCYHQLQKPQTVTLSHLTSKMLLVTCSTLKWISTSKQSNQKTTMAKATTPKLFPVKKRKNYQAIRILQNLNILSGQLVAKQVKRCYQIYAIRYNQLVGLWMHMCGGCSRCKNSWSLLTMMTWLIARKFKWNSCRRSNWWRSSKNSIIWSTPWGLCSTPASAWQLKCLVYSKLGRASCSKSKQAKSTSCYPQVTVLSNHPAKVT